MAMLHPCCMGSRTPCNRQSKKPWLACFGLPYRYLGQLQQFTMSQHARGQACVQTWASIFRTLGSSVWQHTIVALSHGRMKGLPHDTTYGKPCRGQSGVQCLSGG